MTTRPWMPLYVADYLADTLDLGAEESGVYLLMLMIAWRRPDGALPNDMAWLKRSLASCVRDMHGNRFNRVVPKLLERYFELGSDDKYRNKRLTNEREKAQKLSEKQREIAEKRWSKTNKNNNLSNANAMPLHLQSQSQSQEKKEDKEPSLRSGENVSRETADGWPKDFREQFWNRYPRKVGKATALRCLERVRKSGIAFDAIIAGIERIPKQDLQFVPHPATWLNRGGWDDEEIPGGSNGHRGPRALQDDRLSLTKAADRLIDQAERGEFSFGPRPSLLPESGQNDLRLLPKG